MAIATPPERRVALPPRAPRLRPAPRSVPRSTYQPDSAARWPGWLGLDRCSHLAATRFWPDVPGHRVSRRSPMAPRVDASGYLALRARREVDRGFQRSTVRALSNAHQNAQATLHRRAAGVILGALLLPIALAQLQ